MSEPTASPQPGPESSPPAPATRPVAARLGLIVGPLLALALYFLLPAAPPGSEEAVAGLSATGRAVAAVGVLMAVLWLTEALPVSATALLPIALFPLVTGGELGIRAVAAPYAHELIFLYMGGFMLALAMERWKLHRRIALRLILMVGTQPTRIVLGFMLASALLSMWISNTATVVMMLPIALSVIELVRERVGAEKGPEGHPFPFAICLLLGTAYAASIGGIATLIGTPPNLLLAAFLEDSYGLDLSFAAWLPLGLTISVLLLPCTWWLLVRWLYPIQIEEIPGGSGFIRTELDRLGPLSTPERRVLTVFLLTAAAWISRPELVKITIAGFAPLSGLSDPGIAMVAALILFALPSGSPKESSCLLTWKQAARLPWGILILFGGGLSLASSVRAGGVDSFIGTSLQGLSGVPVFVLVAVVTAVVVLLTELTSNTATTATFLPIVGATAQGLGVDPLLLLVPMTLAASCAFMMPVATPPNAIVFGSGELTIPQMCRAGIWLNLLALVVILLAVYTVGSATLGIGGA